LWDVDPATGLWSQGQSLPRHGIGVFQAEATPDSNRLVTLSRETAIVWDLRPDGGFGEPKPGIPGRWVANPPEVVEPGRLVVAPTRPLSPEGVNFFLEPGPATVDVAATFVDPRTGAVVEQVEVGSTVAWSVLGASVAVSPDRRWVAVTSAAAATVIDARTREVEEVIEIAPDGVDDPDGEGLVWSAAWSPDGARLLLGVEVEAGDELSRGDVVAYETVTWTEVDRGAVDIVPDDIELDPDGRWLAVADINGTEVPILDAETLDVRETVTLGLHDRLLHMSFSPDGRLLAGAGFRGGLHIIDSRTWEAREPVLISDEALLQVEWRPDGRTVVVTAVDGTVSVFDAERALVRAQSLPASPDGERGFTRLVPDPDDEIVLLNDRNPALRYSMDPAVWLRDACTVVARDLTREEWDRYLPGRPYAPTCSDVA
jgi:WD40 repeat protein